MAWGNIEWIGRGSSRPGAASASRSLNENECSHVWIDPEAAPIARESIAPIIGTGAHMMRRGRTYKCQNCGSTFVVPER